MKVHAPHGPLKIGTNRQITIPAELVKAINLAPGDSVYVAMADDEAGTLAVIPVEKLVRWIDAGRGVKRNSTSAEDAGNLSA